MTIVFEGPDGSGKSTEAASLARTKDLILWHSGGPKSTPEEFRSSLAEMMALPDNYVVDRDIRISELVYGPVYRGGTIIPAKELVISLLETQWKTYYCVGLPHFVAESANAKDNKAHKSQEHRNQLLDKVYELIDRYDQVMGFLETCMPVVRLYPRWKGC